MGHKLSGDGIAEGPKLLYVQGQFGVIALFKSRCGKISFSVMGRMDETEWADWRQGDRQGGFLCSPGDMIWTMVVKWKQGNGWT